MNKRITGGIVAVLLATGGVGVAAATSASANSVCTYTQGYYKTHWDQTMINGRVEAKIQALLIAHVPGATDLISVYNTPPKGDAFLIAAHQYVTAAINGFPGYTDGNGVFHDALDPNSAVGMAFYGLSTYFQNPSWYTRDQVIAWAATLDQYNNGLLTLPHC